MSDRRIARGSSMVLCNAARLATVLLLPTLGHSLVASFHRRAGLSSLCSPGPYYGFSRQIRTRCTVRQPWGVAEAATVEMNNIATAARRGRGSRLVLTASLGDATASVATSFMTGAGAGAEAVSNAVGAVGMGAAGAAGAAGAGAGAGAEASAGLLASVLEPIMASAPLLGSLGVLTLVIAFHEAGHLVAALSQGIRVKGYSIGFGPKLFSYRSGGVAPEGGKVGLAGVLARVSGPSWDWGGLDEQSVGREEESESEPEPKPIRGIFGRARKEKPVVKEPPPADKSVEFALRAIPVGGFVSFPNNYEVNPKGEVKEFDDPDLLGNRGPGSRAVVVAAGVIVNLLLSWACVFGTVATNGISKPHFAPGVVINEVSDNRGGAAKVGLRARDVLLSINGEPLGDNRSALDQAVSKIRASDGKPLAMEVIRNGAKPVVRMVQPSMGSSGKYSIGVRLAPNLEYVETQRNVSPFAAAEIAVQETRGMVTQTVDALGKLVSSGDTEGVSGPVEIVKVGAELASEDGASALLQFAAIISVNLAVINALPVPGLDGGQMVFIIAEAISRRKIDRTVTDTINGLALFILLTVSLSTIAGDLRIPDTLERIIAGVLTARPPSP